MALEAFSKKFIAWAATAYKRNMAVNLNKAGLRYEDLWNNEDPVIKEAMMYAEPDILTGRYRRLKRAHDLAVKGKLFIDYAQPIQEEEMWRLDFQEDCEKIDARNEEFETLNLHKK